MGCSIGNYLPLLIWSLVVWLAFFSYAFFKAWEHLSNIQRCKSRQYRYQKVLFQYLLVTKVGSLYDLMTGVLSVMSTVLFVYDTYSADEEGSSIVYKFELVLANYFMTNWFVQIYAAPRKISYCISIDSIVDLLTCLPVYVELCSRDEESGYAGGFLRTAKVWRVTKLIRVLRMFRPVQILARDAFGPSNPVMSRIFQKVAWFAILLIIISGVVQVLSGMDTQRDNSWNGDSISYSENNNSEDDDAPKTHIIPFHDAFYFVVVTMSTVGYGDLTPVSFKSRLLVACLLMLFMVVVPGQISQISDLMRRSSKAARHWMSRKHCGHHILVVCDKDAHDAVEAVVKEVRFYVALGCLRESSYVVSYLSRVLSSFTMIGASYLL